jgi:hypothetical protein
MGFLLKVDSQGDRWGMQLGPSGPSALPASHFLILRSAPPEFKKV